MIFKICNFHGKYILHNITRCHTFYTKPLSKKKKFVTIGLRVLLKKLQPEKWKSMGSMSMFLDFERFKSSVLHSYSGWVPNGLKYLGRNRRVAFLALPLVEIIT